jgi:hypothetical protein
MLWRAIKETWDGLTDSLSLGRAGKKRRIQLVKAKIRHHFETSQARVAGGALFNYAGLVQGGVIQGNELAYAQEALDELVADGILECVASQSYALHGRGPFGRLNPP